MQKRSGLPRKLKNRPKGRFILWVVVIVNNPLKTVVLITFVPIFFPNRLHDKHPWYSEQLAFLLVNTDNNPYLTKEELMEASKISEDISSLNFSSRQLENLVDGLIGIGKIKDIYMVHDMYYI